MRVGEIFDRYFDGGARKSGVSIGAWLTMRSEVRQQLMLADPKTVVSDNDEAYFLLDRAATTNLGARREWTWQVTDNSAVFRFVASCNQLSCQ